MTMILDILKGIDTLDPIALATRRGNNIENTRLPSGGNQAFNDRLRRALQLSGSPRRVAYGQCNCHGLVFANRRTAIGIGSGKDADRAIWKIIAEDGYRQLRDQEEAQDGDVAVYLDLNGNVLHSGLVVGCERLSVVGGYCGASMPRVLSKWGADGGEDVHHPLALMNHSVYNGATIQWWTDRP